MAECQSNDTQAVVCRALSAIVPGPFQLILCATLPSSGWWYGALTKAVSHCNIGGARIAAHDEIFMVAGKITAAYRILLQHQVCEIHPYRQLFIEEVLLCANIDATHVLQHHIAI